MPNVHNGAYLYSNLSTELGVVLPLIKPITPPHHLSVAEERHWVTGEGSECRPEHASSKGFHTYNIKPSAFITAKLFEKSWTI